LIAEQNNSLDNIELQKAVLNVGRLFRVYQHAAPTELKNNYFQKQWASSMLLLS